jgi:DNA-binding GntR family transcriptional regulator
MNSDKSIPQLILEVISNDGLVPGDHLRAQVLADRFNVSRSPVNDALALLASKGLLRREPNRGYFLAKTLDAKMEKKLSKDSNDKVGSTYFQIAEDLLKGILPLEISESLIRDKYELTAAQLKTVLNRIAQEGWAQRKPGYGWEFSSMLTTPDSLLQSYRLRLAVEPAALLEPTYHLEPEILNKCRVAEYHLLDGGIETDTPDQLHERGVRFHESLVDASGNPFLLTRFAESIVCVDLFLIDPCKTASVIRNIVSSICNYWT